MSCFTNSPMRKIDETLVDKILEQGQKLRNAMVQSIITNDPFNTDLPLDSPKTTVKLDELPQESNDKIKKFLQGDYMSRQDEISIFETLRSMSSTDLCRATAQTYRSNGSCNCSTCLDYNAKDLNCDLKRANDVTKTIQEKYKSNATNLMKFVDSLKISIGSVLLNEAGEKKVAENVSRDKVAAVSQSFFLEYVIPEELRLGKIQSKTDSGLDFGNVVRFCSRRGNQQAINFKQTSIHDIAHLEKVKLNEIVLKFRITFRHFKQKQPVTLGWAQFNFGSFELTKNFTCNQDLSIKFDDNTPLVLGAIRVSLQLGCGRLYFGKEFIDGINQNKENSILGSDELSDFSQTAPVTNTNYQKSKIDLDSRALKLDLDTKSSRRIDNLINFEEISYCGSDELRHRPKSRIEIKNKPFNECKCQSFQQNDLETLRSRPELRQKTYLEDSVREIELHRFPKPKAFSPEQIYMQRFKPSLKSSRSFETANSKSAKSQKFQLKNDNIEPELILFGYVNVSEAEFKREVLNSFVTCQIFAQDVSCTSNIVAFSSNPKYNFTQQIPLIYEEDLLLKFRENFMVLEFFEKNDNRNFPIGIAKLPLHQFYVSYRNRVISKYLSEKLEPIISIDGWQSIIHPINDEIVGQVNILLALGTKEQIDRLQSERNSNKTSLLIKEESDKRIDIGVQSEIIMDEPTKETANIETLLNQLVAQKPRNIHVENSTNTEITTAPLQQPLQEQPENVRSTSDLLDSLQKVLTTEKKTFKAQVCINNALHLPSRKKCKSKKSKGKKPEDILPSTYVTFEPTKGDLKMTQIIPKCTSPKWDFKCDVVIPTDYLTNNQKLLIFKVWRKSVNTTMQPNFQTDVVIGIASVDLTVLSAGLPSVQGWYNITDLTKKCNGQINIHVTPQEPIARTSVNPPPLSPSIPLSIDTSDLSDDEPGELLGRALKRKFTELDEITQRLRLRLSKVTNDESDASNDDVAEEFEHDINTLCVEDDFDMVDFEKESSTLHANRKREIGLLQTDDVNLNKQKLDTLLEKLSLLSAENNSRYVSGCSQIDTEAMLNDLDHGSRPNIHTSASFDRNMSEKFGGLLEISTEQPDGDGNNFNTATD